ncbi:NEDD8 activating enzyme, partial [Massospora cicadina]
MSDREAVAMEDQQRVAFHFREQFGLEDVKILVLGAGGLGCEILKNLALLGFKQTWVIDMDTIDISNLNRQFLFRDADVGKPKAEVAAAFVNKRVPGVQVIPIYDKLQNLGVEFYSQFHMVISGLDSVEARRWINATLYGIAEEEGVPRIFIDGGTEGFKGQARLMLLKGGEGACFECSLDMFNKQVTYPLCTIANTPRLPEHCIEWASVLEWPRVHGDKKLDNDDPEHVSWLFKVALDRGKQFGITGITYALTQGVIKNIIPAVASTNAIIAATCCNEAYKLVNNYPYLDNYMTYSGTVGVYTYTFPLLKRPDCPVCSNEPIKISVNRRLKLGEFVDSLKENPEILLKNPSIRSNGKSLRMVAPPQLEELTRPNLKKAHL